MSGVFPVYSNTFSIGTAGRNSTVNDFKSIADLTTFSPSFDNTTEEWTPLETGGWIKRFTTGKSCKIGFSGKRNVGDAGNDYVSGLGLKKGTDTQSVLKWTFPDGITIVTIPCIVNVTNSGGGDSTGLGALEFEILSDGAPSISTGDILIEGINDITMSLTGTVQLPVNTIPSGIILTVLVTQTSGTGNKLTATIVGGSVKLVTTAATAGDVYKITISANMPGFATTIKSFYVTCSTFA